MILRSFKLEAEASILQYTRCDCRSKVYQGGFRSFEFLARDFGALADKMQRFLLQYRKETESSGNITICPSDVADDVGTRSKIKGLQSMASQLVVFLKQMEHAWIIPGVENKIICLKDKSLYRSWQGKTLTFKSALPWISIQSIGYWTHLFWNQDSAALECTYPIILRRWRVWPWIWDLLAWNCSLLLVKCPSSTVPSTLLSNTIELDTRYDRFSHKTYCMGTSCLQSLGCNK